MKLNRILLTLALSIFVSTGALATNQDIKITIDGVKLQTNVPSKAINNRTMVPMRAIFEAMGVKVDWENGTQTAIGRKDNDTIKLQIGNPKASINGKEIILDSPAVIVNGDTLVPVRFIAESLGSNVDWDSKTKTVVINNKDNNKVDNKSNNEAITYTDSKYFEFDKAKGEITGYSDNGPKNVVIPKNIDGVDVWIIGDSAFESKNIESVTFPDDLRRIEGYSFDSNNLTEVVFPKGLTYIGERAFSGNNLKTLMIPDNVKAIGLWAFWFNDNLTLVTMPANVRIDRPENPKDWNEVYGQSGKKVEIITR